MGRLFVGAGFVLDLGRPRGPLVGVPLAALQPLQLEVVGDAVVLPRRHQSPHVRREGYVDAGGQLGGPRRRRGFGSLAGPGALGVEPEVGEELCLGGRVGGRLVAFGRRELVLAGALLTAVLDEGVPLEELAAVDDQLFEGQLDFALAAQAQIDRMREDEPAGPPLRFGGGLRADGLRCPLCTGRDSRRGARAAGGSSAASPPPDSRR
jgi:hypothetical protein